MNIDQQIDAYFSPVADFTASVIFYGFQIGDWPEVKIILLWLLSAALFFTFYLNFINLRYFKHAIDVVMGKHDQKTEAEGEITRFQALATSLSGTVGLGNIAGVAVAVSVGGPGAVFWMIVMAFFSMSTKFAEVTMGVKYRQHLDPNNPEDTSGGPMYYIRAAFNARNWPRAGKIVAAVFAVCCIGGSIGGGNMFQANQAYQQVMAVTGGETGWLGDKGWLFGIGLSILVGGVIIGGIQSIANVASKLVPLMAAIYLIAGCVVLALEYYNIPGALMIIFKDAFSLEAGFGGLLGGLLVGIQRAAFSNEAGLGSCAIVHACVKAEEPVSQGFVGMLGPFIDTVVICLMTALVIVVSGVYTDSVGMEGVALTSRAMASAVSWFPYVLALTVFLFAYSTLISWSYYGVKALTYLFGEKKSVILSYKIFFCLCVIVGASSQLDSIILFTDAMILSLAFPNILGLYLLAPELKRDVQAYLTGLRNKSMQPAAAE